MKKRAKSQPRAKRAVAAATKIMKIPSYYRDLFESWFIKLYDPLFRLGLLGKSNKSREIIAEAMPKKPGRILDMATGTGEVAIHIKEMLPDADVIGIDLSKSMLSIAKDKSARKDIGIKFMQRNVESTGFKKDCFDAVTISFALHEMPQENRLNVIKEARRVLKKNGRFVIMDFNEPKGRIMRMLLKAHIKLLEPNYASTILKEDFAKELKENGFNKVRYREHFDGLIQLITGDKWQA